MTAMKQINLLILATLLASGCGSACGGANPGSNANRDAGPELDIALQDAEPRDADPDGSDATDDGGRPVGIQYDYCDQDLFKLHFGPTEDFVSLFLHDHYVVSSRWVDYPEQNTLHDLYMLDLHECKEYMLIKAPRVQAAGSMLGKEIVGSDSSYENYTSELFLYDIEQWNYTRLTFTPGSEGHPRYNGRHLIYWDGNDAPEGKCGLTLWDMQTDEKTTLASWQSAPEVHALSDRYAAWTAYSFDPPGYGKDVFYHDLQTSTTTRIESTGQFHTTFLDLDGDRIVWTENDNDHYNVILYEIETGEETHLTGDGNDHMAPLIRKNLVVFATYRYAGGRFVADPAHRDLELYDLDTGVSRRITKESTTWTPRKFDPPWLLFVKALGSHKFEVYVMNMLKAGVIDEAGNLIPE